MYRKTSRRENPPASRSKIVIIWVSFPVSTVWEQLMYPLRLQHTAPSWTPWAKWVEPGKSTPSRDTDMDRGIAFIDEMRSLTAVQSHTLFLRHNKCRRLLLCYCTCSLGTHTHAGCGHSTWLTCNISTVVFLLLVALEPVSSSSIRSAFP